MKFGVHADATQENVAVLVEKGIKYIQFIPGGRLTYKCPDLKEKVKLLLDNRIAPVFHAPLCCFCVSDNEKVGRLTRLYVYSLSKELESILSGVKFKLVLHAGASERLSNEVFRELNSFCSYVVARTPNIILCIENDAGSKKGTKIGSVDFIVDFCRKFNNPNVKVCIDTNHAWGHPKEEFDVTDMSCWDDVQDVLGVIHYNCIPSICDRYGMLDRHSSNLLAESGDSVSWLMELWKRAYAVPYITERNDLSLSVKDFDWVRSIV